MRDSGPVLQNSEIDNFLLKILRFILNVDCKRRLACVHLPLDLEGDERAVRVLSSRDLVLQLTLFLLAGFLI